MAGVISAELGKTVTHVDLPVDAWGDVLAGAEGVTESLITHLKAVALYHKDGVFRGETDVVETIGGLPPQSLGAFIREHRGAFEEGGQARGTPS